MYFPANNKVARFEISGRYSEDQQILLGEKVVEIGCVPWYSLSVFLFFCFLVLLFAAFACHAYRRYNRLVKYAPGGLAIYARRNADENLYSDSNAEASAYFLTKLDEAV